MTETLVVAAADLSGAYPERPFRIRHALAGHPLLQLPRIVELTKQLDKDRIEYNSGKLAPNQKPEETPLVDMPPEEVVRKIETAGAWMVLKRIESSPEYRQLLEDCLMSVARARGCKSLEDAEFRQIEGFLFVSSPNSTTPFHLDSEDNFFVQIHGEKFFRVYDNQDRTIADDDAIEHSLTKHRNLKYDDSFKPRGTEFHLFGGDGCYVPYKWPHWVRTANQYSISMAITWRSKAVHRDIDLQFCNAMLRDAGFPQKAPGRNPAWDAVKLAFYRTGVATVRPLRQSETLRRVLRRIVRGKDANYFLKNA
jgi:hypothetical protein